MADDNGWLWVFRFGVFKILLASLLFLLGFATTNWHREDNNGVSWGLWQRCPGAQCESFSADELPAYHIGTQALQIVACVFYALSPIIHWFFYCSKTHHSSQWRTRIFDIGIFIGALVHISSVVLFGLEHGTDYLGWSYQMSAAAAAIFTIGVFLTTISRKKALRKFGFLSTKKRRSKIGFRTSLVGSSSSRASSRGSTPRKGKGRSPSSSLSSSTTSGRSIQPQQGRIQQQISPLARNSKNPNQIPSFTTQNSGVPYPHGQGYSTSGPQVYPVVSPRGAAISALSRDPAYPPQLPSTQVYINSPVVINGVHQVQPAPVDKAVTPSAPREDDNVSEPPSYSDAVGASTTDTGK